MFDLADIPNQSLSEVKPESFIFTRENSIPESSCAEMIKLFEDHPEEQYPGAIGKGVDTEISKSTDLFISNPDLSHWAPFDSMLFQALSTACEELRGSFPGLDVIGLYRDKGYQMQRTLTNEFYLWHVDGSAQSVSDRFMVCIWYLNDDFEGGHTDFKHQDVSIKPVPGKLLMFPPFWTHLHQGCPVLRGTKYIVTTWLVYQENPNAVVS